MKTTIDRFGRILLSKAIRNHFGLAPGAEVEMVERGQEIVIRPISGQSPLQIEDGVLIFAGEATGDITSWVRKVRGLSICRSALKIDPGSAANYDPPGATVSPFISSSLHIPLWVKFGCRFSPKVGHLSTPIYILPKVAMGPALTGPSTIHRMPWYWLG